VLTGNPFYSLNVGGFFPVNPVFSEWSAVFHRPIAATFSAADTGPALLRYFALWALPALLGLIALLVLLAQRMREARVFALFITVSLALWVLSVGHTAGGLFYSLRVLSPAFALLAVAGGYGLGLLNHSRSLVGAVALLVAGVLLESLPKTLVLPENPYRLAANEWFESGGQFNEAVRTAEKRTAAIMTTFPRKDGARILTDNAGLPRVLAPLGIKVVPFWSPEVAWLFDPATKPEELAKLWKKSGLNYIVVGKNGPTADFVQTHARWSSSFTTVTTVFENETLTILQAATNPVDPN